MKKVSIVLKNGDFTEGVGPMLFHKVFGTFKDAEDYVKQQVGIFGSPQYETPTRHYFGGVVRYVYNGYDIYPDVRVECDLAEE